ncbi:MAG: phospholipase D-like domain-containing protein [Bauldia sp.]|nr:phospholipase D-like domain-containing protein [Bauldia sp.]
MRVRRTSDGLSAMAVAGNHVVLIGWDLSEADIRQRNILGFSMQRRRHEDGEVIWLPGMKTFKSVEPNPDPGVPVSSFHHPLQTFQWADYTVSPNKTYTYTVVARSGPPAALGEAVAVHLTVTTERVDQGRHAIFFNRGAIASQEYARRFQNRPPDEVGQEAFDWLSRGLVESLEAYIGQAGASDELRGAFFEFKNQRIFDALKAAKGRGAEVKVLYDGDTQGEANREALANSGIKALTKARMHSGNFAHNKFLVLRRAGVSEEVWTGSTNLSQNGIYGHSNNAHLVRDQAIAEAYFQYWLLLDRDLTRKPTAQANDAVVDVPPQPWNDETMAVFSPRTTTDALDWYAALAAGAQRGLFATFAFGMDGRFVTTYDRADDVLRFALMEKKGNGKTFKQQAKEIDRIRKRPNTVVSVGNYIAINRFDRWLKEIDRAVNEVNVRFIHTKYMLIDPLGSKPVVIVGSANFSKASCDTNDENMLVIRGNKAVADVYMGEFMRLFSHYAFRESLTFKGALDPVSALKRKHLIETPDWIEGDRPSAHYFKPGNDRTLRRLYFSGQ